MGRDVTNEMSMPVTRVRMDIWIETSRDGVSDQPAHDKVMEGLRVCCT
jgi:hypothetical protein